MKMKQSTIADRFKITVEKTEKTKYISFSQYSNFAKCPRMWKLASIDRIKLKGDTIHTIFGNAMHSVIQNWLRVMFTTTIKESEAIDFASELMEIMNEEYLKVSEKSTTAVISPEEMTEFYIDGLAILNWLRRNRKLFFSTKHDEFIGIELELALSPNPAIENLLFLSFLDLVFRDKSTGKYRIIDLKTSKMGWSHFEKKDDVKTSQLILYKIFFAQQFNVPIDDIEVEYMILKRKMYENVEFPQKRVQVFKPASGKVTYNRVLKQFNEFVNSAFTPDGSFNLARDYTPVCGEYGKNCKFCEYRDLHDLCNPADRVV